MSARYSRSTKVVTAVYLAIVFVGVAEGFYREADHGLSSAMLVFFTLPFGLLAWIPSALRMAYVPREEMTLLMFGLSGALNALIFLESVRFFTRKKAPNQTLLPTAMSVTDRASIRSAPDTGAADLR